jgi:hypothetical protein
MCKTKIQIFYCKNKTRIEQSYDKNTKLVLSKLNVIKGLIFIDNPWGFNSKNPLWKLRPHVWPMTRLRMNRELINN